jgi:DNA-binding response OmpR family regulator
MEPQPRFGASVRQSGNTEERPSACRILLVDDELVVRDTMSTMIRRMGHIPYLAKKGEEGIQIFRQDRPHLVLLDLGLPDMDGLTVFKRIRTLVPEARIVILTGGGTEEQEIEARRLGADDFVLKGTSLDVLQEMVNRALSQTNKDGK